MSQAVCITGVGVVSSIGVGADEFWESLLLGASGVDETPPEWAAERGAPFAARAMDFDPADYLRSEKNYLDRHSELGFAALKLALDDAGLAWPAQEPLRAGIALGTCWGNMATMQRFYDTAIEKGPRFAPPILFPHAYANTTASLLAIEYEIKGPHANFTSGLCAGADALAWAVESLRRGRADVMVALGVDALCQPLVQCFGLSGEAGGEESRPFHEARDGFIPGEGAAALVLERADHARARRANPYAALAGVGAGVGRDLPVRIDTAMRRAWEDAGASGADAVFAAANGSQQLDWAEAAAINDVLGDAVGDAPVTALKAGLGEMFAAAAPMLAAAAALSIARSLTPPTPDAEGEGFLLPLPVDPVVGALDAALVNCIDPRGAAMSFLLRKPEGC